MVNVCNSQNPCVSNDYTEIKLLYTESGNNVRGISVSNDITNAVVFGTILIKSDDKKYVCTIKEVK